jgi:hypothetical protein
VTSLNRPGGDAGDWLFRHRGTATNLSRISPRPCRNWLFRWPERHHRISFGKLIQHFLVLGIQRCRQSCLHLAAIDEGFQLA